MKEPQKSKIIALLMDYSAGVYQNKEMPNLIESILSPLPHQDGASAEDVVKATIMGYVDPNKVAKISGELMRVFKSETANVLAEKDREIAAQIYAKEHFRTQAADMMFEIYNIKPNLIIAQSDLSASNAHRTRLIESVKKWGGAWRKCRAELKEAKKEIERLKEFGFMYNGLNK